MEETFTSGELQQIFLENGILENANRTIKVGAKYPIVWNSENTTLTVEGISYGLYEDLYTVLISEG